MNFLFHFEHNSAKRYNNDKKKKKKEQKKKRDLNSSKNVMLKSIVIKKSLNTSHLTCLKIFI